MLMMGGTRSNLLVSAACVIGIAISAHASPIADVKAETVMKDKEAAKVEQLINNLYCKKGHFFFLSKHSSCEYNRLTTAILISEMGDQASKTVPAIMAALDDLKGVGRRNVLNGNAIDIALKKALVSIGERAIPPLVGRLRASDEFVSFNAAEILSAMEEKSVPSLITELNNGKPHVRKHSAWALGEIGENAAPAVLALADALRDKDNGVRQEAAWALGRMGERAAPAISSLAIALRDESGNKDLHWTAAYALGRMGKKATPAVRMLIIALKKDEDEHVRSEAADTLGIIGEEAAPAIPALTDALKDKDEHVRSEAAKAIEKIKTHGAH